ncbi:hypothetical protein R6Q59_029155 [Mikania micrantha]
MTRILTFLAVMFMVFNSFSFTAISRPIIDAYEIKNSDPSPGGRDMVSSIGSIKNSGPSFGGRRHESRNAESLVDMKSSGPSARGKGHEFPTTESLGNLNKSNPSPRRKGHENSNDNVFGMIKNSGPSHEGKGHGFKNNERVDMEIYGSGPSLNGSKQMFSNRYGTRKNVKTMGLSHAGVTRHENRYETKGSGPSSGGKGH